MLRSAHGFTLLEVLIALLVVTVGLIGLVGSLGPMAKLAGEGKARGRAALVLASRTDLLRAAVKAAGPGCTAPPGGSLQHPDGVLETWTAALVGPSVELRIVANRDTLVTRVPCP